jgi:hypothetical protein
MPKNNAYPIRTPKQMQQCFTFKTACYLTAIYLFFIFPLTSPIHAQTTNVLYLSGQGAHVILPPSLFHQFSEATIETWVKWEQIQNWARVFDFGREGNAVVLQSEKSSRTLNFAIYDRNGDRHRIQANNAIPVGQWFHVAVTCGAQGMALYINGELVGTDTYTGGLEQVTGGTYYIGRSNWADDKPFQGYISEFRIWNEQRSQTQIQRTMQRRLTGKEPNLVAYWHFDQAQDDQVSNTANTYSAQLIQNAHLVSVTPIARYLIPGEMEKEKEIRQASAQTNWERGNYIGAYRDYQAALDLSPNSSNIRTNMLKALEKSHITAALMPFQITNTKTNSEVTYLATYTYLTHHRPAYIEWLTPATIQFLQYEQGLTTRTPQQTIIEAAKSWNIRLVVLATIKEINIDPSGPKRESQTAYLRADHQTLSDSLSTVRYNIISQQVKATSQALLQVIDVETGRILNNQLVRSEIQDQVEYADYSGDPYALWTKRGARYQRLINQESRFLARQKLKTDNELTHEALEELGNHIAQQVASVVATYHP